MNVLLVVISLVYKIVILFSIPLCLSENAAIAEFKIANLGLNKDLDPA